MCMGGKVKGEPVAKDKKQKKKTIPVTKPGAASAAVMATYADGQPAS